MADQVWSIVDPRNGVHEYFWTREAALSRRLTLLEYGSIRNPVEVERPEGVHVQ